MLAPQRPKGPESATAGLTPARVLSLVFVLNLLARGVGEAFAVFLVPLGDAFDYDRAQLTTVYSAYALLLGFAAPLAGWLFDRHGARACYVTGLLLLGTGCCLAANASNLLMLLLSAGVLLGAGAAAVGMVPATVLVSRWYTHNLGTAMGIAYAGLSAGVMVFALLTERLIEAGGYQFAYRSIGVALLIIAALIAVLPWRRIERGLVPAAQASNSDTPRSGMAIALRSSGFWALAIVFCLTAVAIYSVSVQLVAYLVSLGFTPLVSATAYGASGALSIVGMLSAGHLSDRFGRRATATLSYLITMTGVGFIALLSFVPALPLLAVAMLFFGISAGSRGPIISALCARLFAGPGLAAVIGALSIGLGVGSASGAWLAGVLHDATGSYGAGFALSLLAAATAMALFHLVPALRGEQPTVRPSSL